MIVRRAIRLMLESFGAFVALVSMLLVPAVAQAPDTVAPTFARTIGDPSAERLLVAYLSPSCTFCKEFYEGELSSLETGGLFSEGRIETGDLQVQIVLTPRNDSDVKIIAGITCLSSTEAFRKGLDHVFRNQSALWEEDFSDDDALGILTEAGVDDPKKCMNDPARLAATFDRRRNIEHRIDLEGFPVFESGGRFLQGKSSLDEINGLIDGP